ncbi:MAG: bifunctional hydroxymethylpyrimidine kinase/phosphomethylpyrimidine kinase [Spirochaetaceae bacterium]|nr:bifunctional hydroxymethylpyrimidine kinase/phosphomethylpyrimidine kinase [Spirochaetaceae bacterium]
MTKREEEVLNLIKENPLISQKDCAAILNISRSAVAGHIMNLSEKGYIKGKGYILKDEPYAVVIGGSNMDIQGSPSSAFISRDSNPGTVHVSAGGVGRNIAENLSRLGISVKLLTLLGNDLYGKQLLEDTKSAGVDMNHVKILNESPTSTYLSILDEKKDMISAISSMSIMDNFNTDYIDRNHRLINSASILVIDANLPGEIINHLISKYRNMAIFIDTVSTAKAEKVKDIIGRFHTIKPNILEAEVLSGMKIYSLDDMKKASLVLLDKGVKRVFLTMGEKGILYSDSDQSFLYKSEPVKPVNTTGAGDAFTAALTYCFLMDYSIIQTLDFASSASALTVLHEDTINKNLTVEYIQKMMKGDK